MAVCKKCHKTIPDGKDFCEECELNNKMQADESYLEGLLNSVMVNEPPNADNQEANARRFLRQRRLEKETEAVAKQEKIQEEKQTEPELADKQQQGGDPDMEELLDSLFGDVGMDADEPAVPEDELLPEDINAIFDEAAAMDESFAEIPTEDTPAEEEPPTAVNPAEDPFTLMENISVEPSTDELFEAIDDEPSAAAQESPEDDGAVDIDALMASINSGGFEEELSSLAPDTDGKPPKEKKKKKEKTEKRSEKKKNKSLFKRLFSNIREERTPEEEEALRQKFMEEAEERKRRAEEKKRLAAESKEEKKQRLEQEKAEKAEQAAKAKEEKAAAARAKKEEAALKAKQKKEAELAIEEIDEGRINKAGASILVVVFASLAAFIMIGTGVYSYNLSIQNAQHDFDRQRYNEAYHDVYGLDIRDEDIVLYDRIMTVMYVNKQLNSYNNFMASSNYDKALDSLLKGLEKYNKYIQLAQILDIVDDMDYIKAQILGELSNQFGISEAEAERLIIIEEVYDYSEFVYDTADAFNSAD